MASRYVSCYRRMAAGSVDMFTGTANAYDVQGFISSHVETICLLSKKK